MDVHMSGDGLHPNSKASRRQGMVVSVCEEIYEPRKKGYRIAWVSRGYAHVRTFSHFTLCFSVASFLC